MVKPDQSQSTKITVLGIKLDKQDEILDKLLKQFELFEKQVSEHLLHPERGLYSRMTSAGNTTNTVIRDAESTKIVIDGISDSMKRHEQLLLKIEEWIADHERRDGELRESVTKLITNVQPLNDDLKRRASRKPWIDKIVWLVAALVMTTFLTQVGGAIIKVLGDYQRSNTDASLKQ